MAGVLALGGSAGTTIGTAAMRALPIGVPKLMVSTLASGQVRHYVGDKDILMLNSIVDIAGLNRISRAVLAQRRPRRWPAWCSCRSSQSDAAPTSRWSPPRCSASPRPASNAARGVLEAAGYEVLVFHATGSGGQAMESLVADGLIAGVLDITTTELADELVGGVLSAGPDRLTAAGRARRAASRFGRRDRHGQLSRPRDRAGQVRRPHVLPAQRQRHADAHHAGGMRRDRRRHRPQAVAAARAGRRAPAARGVSAIDRAGPAVRRSRGAQGFGRGAARPAAGALEIHELDCHINDPQFADAAAGRLIEMLRQAAENKAADPRQSLTHPRRRRGFRVACPTNGGYNAERFRRFRVAQQGGGCPSCPIRTDTPCNARKVSHNDPACRCSCSAAGCWLPAIARARRIL